ncbi:MAG: hypothetical protein WAR76_19710, partial [Xanthobacteraceae bacterium]
AVKQVNAVELARVYSAMQDNLNIPLIFPIKDTASAALMVLHPNRAPAFNPPHKAGKHCSAFCSEEEGIPTSSGLFPEL